MSKYKNKRLIIMSEKKEKTVEEVFIRSYPKVIFMYPLLITSFILWLLQLLSPNNPIQIYGTIWVIVLFVNLFIMAFDFSSAKFFVLVLVVVVVALLVVFLVLPNMDISIGALNINFKLYPQFYAIISLILAVILGLVWLSSRFDYWKIERNEIYHKNGIFSSAERVPTKSLRLKKEIPDVFEFFVLRAGSITLMPGHGDVIPLRTVLNINKKERQIDNLLSYVSVEPDELD
jgi:hypothetical protein